MPRPSRNSQLPARPPLPPLPDPVEPEDGHVAVGAMCQRSAQSLGVHLPIHMEKLLHGILLDYDTATRNSVDPFFHCAFTITSAACQAVARLGPLQEPGTAILHCDIGHLPVAVDWRADRIVVRCPTDEELG